MNIENSLTLTMAVSDGRLRPSDNQKDQIGLFLAQRMDQQVTVQFSRPRKTRSNGQNRYYWGVVLSMVASETGHTSEECHEYFKQIMLPRQHMTIGEVEQEVPKSSTELTTIEFEQYLERVRAFAAQELRMTIPLPNEV